MVKYNFYKGHPIVFELLLVYLVKYKYTARLIFDWIFLTFRRLIEMDEITWYVIVMYWYHYDDQMCMQHIWEKQEIHTNFFLGYLMASDYLKDIDERLDLRLKCSWCKQAVKWIDVKHVVIWWWGILWCWWWTFRLHKSKTHIKPDCKV